MASVGTNEPDALVPGSPEAIRQVAEHREQLERERELREEAERDADRRRVLGSAEYREAVLLATLEGFMTRLEKAVEAIERAASIKR